MIFPTRIQRFIAGRSSALFAVLVVALVAELGFIATSNVSLAQDRELKIGIIGPFSGPAAGAAQQVLDGLMLGVDSAGGKIGGLKTAVIREDDQLKPDVGLQAETS